MKWLTEVQPASVKSCSLVYCASAAAKLVPEKTVDRFSQASDADVFLSIRACTSALHDL
jgi:hypothetical protein